MFRDSPLAEFVGVWDDNPARGVDAAQRYGVPFWPDLEALLNGSDAVGITSETVHHARLVQEAASRRRHVLCEKPLAASLEDCEKIARSVASSGITFMQSFPKKTVGARWR